MPCYHPRTIALRWLPSENKYKVIWSPLADPDHEHINHEYDRLVQMPCGRCLGCLEQKAKEWAKRCQLEAVYYPFSSYFVTLTYENDYLHFADIYMKNDPDYCVTMPSLCKLDLIDFIRSLRYNSSNPQPGLRFFGCGEYGPQTFRPHYHILFFNLNLPTIGTSSPDLKPCLGSNDYFLSDFIGKHWNKGFHTIFPYSYGTGQYIAKYLVKDTMIENNSDLIDNREKPFLHMSRRPGIGRRYFDEHKEELLRYDSVTVPSDLGAFQTSMPDYFLRLIRGKDFVDEKFVDWLTIKACRSYSSELNHDVILDRCGTDYSSYLKRAEELAVAQKKSRKNL